MSVYKYLKDNYEFKDGTFYYKGRPKKLRLHKGYYQIRLGSYTVGVARAIYIWHNGDIEPGLVIDHIDGNPKNNELSNLRLVTQVQNTLNRPQHRAGKPPGVSKQGKHKWHSSVTLTVRHNIHLGTELTQELAMDNYRFVRELIDKGADDPDKILELLEEYKASRSTSTPA